MSDNIWESDDECNALDCALDCMMCSGEACNFCGAGCWNNDPDRPRCEHDVLERHEEPERTQPSPP